MTTLRIIALSAIITGISATDTPRAEVPVALQSCLAGKSGEGLAATLRRECRPSTLTVPHDITYTFYDPFTGNEVRIVDGEYPQDYAAGTLVPVEWWLGADKYGDTLRNDLNNFVPLTIEVLHARGDKMPGTLVDVTTQYDRWAVGRALLYGVKADAYAPPAEMRGRLARAFFYMAVIYPNSRFTATAYMMMSGRYPYLLADASEMLVDWARQYPPDDAEREWAEYSAEVQGGYNPFIGIEDLYEYIWGEKSGEVYRVSGERVPLHSTYSVAGGERIELYSPHIPADAVWSIDGIAAESHSYAPADLGVGEHNLTYTSASTGEHGCVMIKIVNDNDA